MNQIRIPGHFHYNEIHLVNYLFYTNMMILFIIPNEYYITKIMNRQHRTNVNARMH